MKKEKAHLIIRKYETNSEQQSVFEMDFVATGGDLLEMVAVALDRLISCKHGPNYSTEEIFAASMAVGIKLMEIHENSKQAIIPHNIIKEVLKNDGQAE